MRNSGAVGAAATQYCPLHCTLFEDDGAKKHIHLFTLRDSLLVMYKQPKIKSYGFMKDIGKMISPENSSLQALS